MPDTTTAETAPDHHTKDEDKNRKKHHRRSRGNNDAFNLALLVIAIIAVRRQLRLPKQDRTWHGTVDVAVPYEFRWPTLERIKRSIWDPSSERLFTPQVFGVGWSVNVARLLGRQR